MAQQYLAVDDSRGTGETALREAHALARRERVLRQLPSDELGEMLPFYLDLKAGIFERAVGPRHDWPEYYKQMLTVLQNVTGEMVDELERRDR